MSLIDVPGPNLITAFKGPLYPLEQTILTHTTAIEAWFRQCWLDTPPAITSSVDLRHSGFKISPVDTNLFLQDLII